MKLAYLILFIVSAAAFTGTACTSENTNGKTPEEIDTTSESQQETDSSADSVTDSSEETDSTDDSSQAIDTENLEWQYANLTWYESYPEEGSAECIEYNGCEWAGWFAGLDEQMTPEWVESHNIAAVHSDHFSTYNGKTLRVRFGDEHQIDVVVYDMCADSDCDGCCTDNMYATGFLIDMEIHTAERFGVMGGIVEFACLDCNK
ncbi:MAG: hypothetical protein JXX29_19310 [Deltaproteobacteria bacterium]|nr:hypothetical protein [Deltaproteobacteria bacterium]MBN2673837.1 hypothetical protein [Deltaproteobacteria bacterium]